MPNSALRAYLWSHAAHLVLLACSSLAMAGTLRAWAIGKDRYYPETISYLGVYRQEGQLACLAIGLTIYMLGVRLVTGSMTLNSYAVLAACYAISAIAGGGVWMDGGRLPWTPVEGWLWFHMSWGLPLMVVSASAGLAITTCLIARTVLRRTSLSKGYDSAESGPPIKIGSAG